MEYFDGSQTIVLGEYYYDGDGKRIKKVESSQTTIYIYPGWNIISEKESSTNIETKIRFKKVIKTREIIMEKRIYIILILGLVGNGMAIAQESEDWTTLGHDLCHTRFSESKLSENFKVIWEFPEYDDWDSSPIVIGKSLFFASTNKLYSINIENGKKNWEKNIPSWPMPMLAEGIGIEKSVAYINGKIFTESEGKEFAFNTGTGSILWQKDFGKPFNSSVTLTDDKGILAVRTYELSIFTTKPGRTRWDKIVSLDINTGEIIWEFSIEACKDNADKCIKYLPVINHKRIYFATNDGEIYCIDMNTGEEIWKVKVNAWEASAFSGQSSLTIYDNRLFFGIGAIILAYNLETGEEIWKYSTKYAIPSSLAAAYGRIYVPTSKEILALDAKTGEKIWNFKTEKDISSPAVADDKVVFGSSNKLYILDAYTGEKIWEYEFKSELFKGHDPIIFSPIIANQKIFVRTIERKMYAFGEDSYYGVGKFTEILGIMMAVMFIYLIYKRLNSKH